MGKQKIESRTFHRVKFGIPMRFGESTRTYVLCNGVSPNHTASSNSLSTGLGKPEKRTRGSLRNPLKSLRRWAEEGGEVLEFIPITPKYQSESLDQPLFYLRLNVKLSEFNTEAVTAESFEAGGDTRHDAEMAVADLACQRLLELGELRSEEDYCWNNWKRFREEQAEEESSLLIESNCIPKKAKRENKSDAGISLDQRRDEILNILKLDCPKDLLGNSDEFDELDVYLSKIRGKEREVLEEELESINNILQSRTK